MKFLVTDLGNLKGGEIIEATIRGSAVNVKLMDISNFNAYKAGKRHNYYGGHVTKSPYRAKVPHSGHWYVTFDLGGYAGKFSASARVLSGILPQVRQPSLSTVPSLVQDRKILSGRGEESIVRQYDVFISHASEDKEDIVRPLAISLQSKGLKVWYDEFELKIGDSLRRKIDKGLANSRFGIVVLSKDFIKKGWTNYELDGIVTKSTSGEQVMLPIWHNITKQEVINYSPSLADKVARNTATYTIDEIANEISDVINGI